MPMWRARAWRFRQKPRRREIQVNIRWGWLLAPSLLVSIGLLVASQAVFLSSSLHRDLGFGRSEASYSLGNYIRFFQDRFYLDALALTVELSLVVAATSLLIGYAAAYVFSRMNARWAAALLAAILMTALVTEVIKVLGLVVIFSADSALNRSLVGLGLVERPVRILGTVPGVVTGLLHFTLGFVILMIFSVLQTIPRSLEDAARAHGASPMRAFWRVTLPLSLPGVIGAGFIVFNLSMGAFTAAALIGGGRILTLPVLIERTMMIETRYGMAATLSAVLLVSVLVLNLLAVFVITRWRSARLAMDGGART